MAKLSKYVKTILMKIRIYSAGASWNECKVCDQSCVADDSNISMTRTSHREIDFLLAKENKGWKMNICCEHNSFREYKYFSRPGWERRAIPLAHARTHHIKNVWYVACLKYCLLYFPFSPEAFVSYTLN